MTFAKMEQAHDSFERGRALNKKQALSIEEQLRNNPTNLEDRFAFLAYLTGKHFQGKDVENIRAKRAEIIFWLIENVPDHAGLGEPECMILFGMDPHYEKFKQLWADQVRKHPSNAAVLGNAAQAVLIEDGELAEKLLIEAERFAPEEPEWPHMLSLVYEFRAKESKNKVEKKRWNSLSEECMDRCKNLRTKQRNASEIEIDNAMIDRALELLKAAPSTHDRQMILKLLVQYWHGQIASEDSIPERILAQYSLPEPLRWWYGWAGNRASIMSGQNFLLMPAELEYRDEAENQKLLFYVENQGVYQWSTLVQGKDPPVYGRFNDDEPWQAEGICLSEHLINVCLFEAIFCHSPFGASASYVPEDKLQKLLEEIPPIAIAGWRWSGGTGFFVKNGIFMHVAKYEASGESCHSVWIGAKSREPLEVLRPFIDDTWENVEF